jgi:hypothetical protein
MTQSVDFLKLLPKSTNRVPLLFMVIGMTLTLVILLIISIVTYINYHTHYSELTNTQRQLEKTQLQYNEVVKKYPLLANDTPLLERVNHLSQQYHTKLAQFEKLTHLLIRPGFSRYMLSLAQVTPNTLWLDEIQIDHSTSNIMLSGYATRPDSVSYMMSHLSTTEAFNNIVFHSFFVRAIKNHSYVSFSVATNTINPSRDNELNQLPTNLKE